MIKLIVIELFAAAQLLRCARRGQAGLIEKPEAEVGTKAFE
jgi:hypothetical protein